MEYTKTLPGLVEKRPFIVYIARVIVLDSHNRVLLYKKENSNTWYIPGDIVELGENAEETAKREVYEETNLLINEIYLFNVYFKAEQRYFYPNGDEVSFVNIVLVSTNYSGDIQINGFESKEITFFNLENLPKNISQIHKLFIKDYFKNQIRDKNLV